MAEVDYAELEQLARAATDGGWRCRIEPEQFDDGDVTFYRPTVRHEKGPLIAEVSLEMDAQYIAAANPATILALLSDLAACRAEIAALGRVTADLDNGKRILHGLFAAATERALLTEQRAARAEQEAAGLAEALRLVDAGAAYGREAERATDMDQQRFNLLADGDTDTFNAAVADIPKERLSKFWDAYYYQQCVRSRTGPAGEIAALRARVAVEEAGRARAEQHAMDLAEKNDRFWRRAEIAEEIAARAKQRAANAEQLHTPIPGTYACQRCGRRDGLDAVADDAAWVLLSGAANGANLLCLWCMDALAADLGIRASVSLHFVGLALAGTSQSDADQEHINRLVAQREDAEQDAAGLREALRHYGNRENWGVLRYVGDAESSLWVWVPDEPDDSTPAEDWDAEQFGPWDVADAALAARDAAPNHTDDTSGDAAPSGIAHPVPGGWAMLSDHLAGCMTCLGRGLCRDARGMAGIEDAAPNHTAMDGEP